MSKTKILFSGLFLAIFMVGNAYSGNISDVSALSISFERNPTGQYQLAKSTWLPDSFEDLGLSGRHNTKYDFNKNDCSSYPLSSCPMGAVCSKCPFAQKYKINSCSSPYIPTTQGCDCPFTVKILNPNDRCVRYCSSPIKMMSVCIEKKCTPNPNQTNCSNGTQACDDGCGSTTAKCCVECTHLVTTKPANSSYTYSSCKDDDGTKNIQTGWDCNSGYHKTSSNTCEKDCNVTNCAGYTLTSCPANGNCSSCTKTAANCSTDGTMYRLDSCASGYSKSGDTCIDNPCPGYEKKSSCPNRYYKKTTCLADTSYIKCEETCGSQIVNDNPTYTIDESNYNTNGTAVVTKDATSIPYASNVYSNINFPQYALCKNLPKPTIRSSLTSLSFNRIENINFIFTGKVSDTPVYGLELNPSGETTNAFNNDAQKSWIGYLKNVDITITSSPVVGIRIGGGAWYNKTIVFEGTNKVTGGTTYTFWLRGHNSNAYGHVKGVLRIANGATLNAASICEYTQWNGILQKYGTFTGNVKTNCSTYTLQF